MLNVRIGEFSPRICFQICHYYSISVHRSPTCHLIKQWACWSPQDNKTIWIFTAPQKYKILIALSMRVYRLYEYYRRICSNQSKMATGWCFHFSRKDQMNSDSRLSDPMLTILEKDKTSGIQLTSNLYQGRIKLFGAPRQWKPFRPLFQTVFLSEGGITPPQTESNTTPPSPKTEITNILFYILNIASIIKFKM